MASAQPAVDLYGDGWTPGRFGVGDGEAGVTIERLRPAGVVEVIGRRGEAGAGFVRHQPPVGRVVHKKNSTLVWTAPRRFWAMSNTDAGAAMMTRWRRKVGSAGYVTDLSQARFGVRITGESARDLLAKGCPVDVDSFAGDQSVGTVCEGMPVILHGCGKAPGFDLWIMRSYGRSLFDWLTHSAAEFGYRLA